MNLPPFFQEKFRLMERFPFTYRPWVASAAATLAGLGIAIAYFQTDFKSSVYAETEALFAKWESSPQDPILFREMKAALHKIPALEKKYEPKIAAKLIETGRGDEALEIARHCLHAIETEAPFHAAFGETSLLIEQQAYQKALEMSVVLKQKMVKEGDLEKFSGEQLVGGAALYAHNLLRIACLQQALKNKPGEMAAWEDLEAFFRLNENSAASRLVLQNFQDKGLNLFDYIAERKKHLYPG